MFHIASFLILAILVLFQVYKIVIIFILWFQFFFEKEFIWIVFLQFLKIIMVCLKYFSISQLGIAKLDCLCRYFAEMSSIDYFDPLSYSQMSQVFFVEVYFLKIFFHHHHVQNPQFLKMKIDIF